jgi:hypothetical protein
MLAIPEPQEVDERRALFLGAGHGVRWFGNHANFCPHVRVCVPLDVRAVKGVLVGDRVKKCIRALVEGQIADGSCWSVRDVRV